MINIKNASCTYINRYTILSDILIYITYIYNHIINIQNIYIYHIHIHTKNYTKPYTKNRWEFLDLHPPSAAPMRSSEMGIFKVSPVNSMWQSLRSRARMIWKMWAHLLYIYIDFIVIYIYIITKKQFEHIWTYLNDFKRISFVWWSNQVMYNVQ
jgi:hypothetical protein